MRSLLHLASKAKLSTSQALFFFLLAAVMAVGLCATTAIRRRRMKLRESRFDDEEEGEKAVAIGSGWGRISEVVARALCWSGRSERVEVERSAVLGWRDAEATAATVGAAMGGAGNGNSVAVMSPLWQRRILMGERCQMPMFSGVIMYDERGRLLRGNSPMVKQVAGCA